MRTSHTTSRVNDHARVLCREISISPEATCSCEITRILHTRILLFENEVRDTLINLRFLMKSEPAFDRRVAGAPIKANTDQQKPSECMSSASVRLYVRQH